MGFAWSLEAADPAMKCAMHVPAKLRAIRLILSPLSVDCTGILCYEDIQSLLGGGLSAEKRDNGVRINKLIASQGTSPMLAGPR